MAGDVSRNQDFYNIFQYDDILQDTAEAIRRQQEDEDVGFEISGEVEIADDYHKMTLHSIFDGDETTIMLGDDDAIKTGLNVRTGHSGFHGLKVQPLALREVCSNGMMGWVADKTFQQSHSEPYQPGMIEYGVGAVVDGTDDLQERLEEAQNRYLTGGKDELRLLMHEMIGEYLDTPVGDIPLSLEREVSDDQVSLYEAYQSMTRALSHHADQSIPQHRLDDGVEAAASILENGQNVIPDPEVMGRQRIKRRANEVIESNDPDLHFDGEDETLRELMEEHEITA